MFHLAACSLHRPSSKYATAAIVYVSHAAVLRYDDNAHVEEAMENVVLVPKPSRAELRSAGTVQWKRPVSCFFGHALQLLPVSIKQVSF